MARAIIKGRYFADAKDKVNSNGKVLFIASYGGVSAEDIVGDYIQILGAEYDQDMEDRFEYITSGIDSIAPPWYLTLGNMIKLQEFVQIGEHDLVTIDSLRAVSSQTKYSVDDCNISEVMRLIQSIVTPRASLLWIYHTNKSGKSSSHSAGGVTDIIKVVLGGFEVQREWDEDRAEQENSFTVHKLRDEDRRSFEYKFNWLTGVMPESSDMAEAKSLEDRKSIVP